MIQFKTRGLKAISRHSPGSYVNVLPSASKTAKVLFGIVLVLTTVSLLGLYAQLYLDYPNLHRYIQHIVERTDVNRELSIPTFFSTLLLTTSSVLLWLGKQVGKGTGRHQRRWAILAVIFLLLALDEATSFHEFLNLTTHAEYLPTNKFLRWTWVIPGMAFALIVFMLYIPFLLALSRRTAGLMILAGTIYVGGAVGIEMIGAALMVDEGTTSLHYGLATHVEELLEMTGQILFIYSLLDYLSTRKEQVVILHSAEQVADGKPQPEPFFHEE